MPRATVRLGASYNPSMPRHAVLTPFWLVVIALTGCGPTANTSTPSFRFTPSPVVPPGNVVTVNGAVSGPMRVTGVDCSHTNQYRLSGSVGSTHLTIDVAQSADGNEATLQIFEGTDLNDPMWQASDKPPVGHPGLEISQPGIGATVVGGVALGETGIAASSSTLRVDATIWCKGISGHT
jgi:hypothetical protein